MARRPVGPGAPRRRGRPLIGISADVEAGDRPTRGMLYLTYADAIRRAGGAPVALLPGEGDDQQALAADLLERLDGVVLSGGDDLDPAVYGRETHPAVTVLHPRRAGFELALTRLALERGTPLLGLCNGAQLLNVARGGDLIVHLDDSPGSPLLMHKPPRPASAYHTVDVTPGSRLASLVGAARLRTNSYHHQSIDTPGDGVEIVARAADGVVEAIELPDHPWALGVQWHPEKMPAAPQQRAIFDAFIAATT